MIQRKNRERKEHGLGWPSCKSFETAGCKLCASCGHYGKIKSPLNLASRTAGPDQKNAAGQNKNSEMNPVVALMRLRDLGDSPILREWNACGDHTRFSSPGARRVPRRSTSEQSVAPSPRIHEMDRRCADAVSGIARRTSSSGPRNQHSEVMSAGRRPGGPTECETETGDPSSPT